MRLQRGVRGIAITFGGQLVKIGTGHLAPVAHQMDETGFGKQRRQVGDQPGQFVGGIAPLRRAAGSDGGAVNVLQHRARFRWFPDSLTKPK